MCVSKVAPVSSTPRVIGVKPGASTRNVRSPAGQATQKRPRLSVRIVSGGDVNCTRAPSIGAPDSSTTSPQRSGRDASPTVSVAGGAGAEDGRVEDSVTSVLTCTGMNVIECSAPAVPVPSSSDGGAGRTRAGFARGFGLRAGAAGATGGGGALTTGAGAAGTAIGVSIAAGLAAALSPTAGSSR